MSIGSQEIPFIGLALAWLYLAPSVGLVPFVARAKGRSGFGWMLTALLCSPLLALIALAAVPSPGPDVSPSGPASSGEPSAWQRRVAGYTEPGGS